MQAVKTALITQLISVNVNGGNGLFDSQAPAAQPFPYILLQYVSGGYENRGSLDERSELWQVKAVTEDHNSAHALANAIHSALHQQTLTINGWRCLWLRQEQHLWLVENIAGRRVFHAGATYRIHLHRL